MLRIILLALLLTSCAKDDIETDLICGELGKKSHCRYCVGLHPYTDTMVEIDGRWVMVDVDTFKSLEYVTDGEVCVEGRYRQEMEF